MKKILFFTFSLFISIVSVGQDSMVTDSLQSVATDSVTASSPTEFSASKLEDMTKAEGDSAYMNDDYASAIQIYEALLNNQGEAAEVYYNLGNSYYKLNDIAKSILNYERALLLQPGNDDIRANLEVARAKTIDKVESIPDIFFISWIRSLTNSLSVDSWATCGVIFFILLIVSLYFFIFSKRVLFKKSGFILGLFSLTLVIASNVFASQQKERLMNRDDAIIISPSVTVRSTPNEGGTSLFILHEGSKVNIKDSSMKEWKEIRLADGKVGWVPSLAIEII